MRPDAQGLFWHEEPRNRKRNIYERPMPPIPETFWQRPNSWPNLSAARCLSFDVETKDPELIEKGPGWARGVGHIVGVAIGADHDGRWYFPMRHETEGEWNIEPEHVLNYLRVELGREHQPKVGANTMYDYGWLRHEGVDVQGQLLDVQFAEALLDERARVNLDALGTKYLDQPKVSDMLYRWLADWFGGDPTDKQRAHIFKTPPRLVGPYAEGDVDLPLRVLRAQYPLLVEQGLVELFELECSLIRLLVDMRFKGVRVDLDRAEQVRQELFRVAEEGQKKIKELIGYEINVDAPTDLVRSFTDCGIEFPYTEAGNPSFTKEFLKTVEHPLAELIRAIRKANKTRGTFIESYILESAIGDRVYGQFHPLKNDESGAVSGRFSGSNPNLQNIPSRDPYLGPLCRSIFIPEDGCGWLRADYSQIEYRMLAHFAKGNGADDLRARYNLDPFTDYHALLQQLVLEMTGMEIPRKPVKNMNFGFIYGMGERKLARSINLPSKEAKKLFAAYHEGAPFARDTMQTCIEEAELLGYTTTILGRRSRFTTWEPIDGKSYPLPYKAAVEKWGLGNLKRAGTYKALNRKLQGSAADMIKVAMARCYYGGLFAETGVPSLTVHDELDWNNTGGADGAFAEVFRIMETCIPLRVPVKVDVEAGPNWGQCA